MDFFKSKRKRKKKERNQPQKQQKLCWASKVGGWGRRQVFMNTGAKGHRKIVITLNTTDKQSHKPGASARKIYGEKTLIIYKSLFHVNNKN